MFLFALLFWPFLTWRLENDLISYEYNQSLCVCVSQWWPFAMNWMFENKKCQEISEIESSAVMMFSVYTIRLEKRDAAKNIFYMTEKKKNMCDDDDEWSNQRKKPAI